MLERLQELKTKQEQPGLTDAEAEELQQLEARRDHRLFRFRYDPASIFRGQPAPMAPNVKTINQKSGNAVADYLKLRYEK